MEIIRFSKRLWEIIWWNTVKNHKIQENWYSAFGSGEYFYFLSTRVGVATEKIFIDENTMKTSNRGAIESSIETKSREQIIVLFLKNNH